MPKPPYFAALVSLLAATIVATATVPGFQSSAQAAQSRAFCRNANQVSATTKLGSQVDGDVVTICLSSDQLKLLKPKPVLRKIVTRPIPKPIVKIPAVKPVPAPTKSPTKSPPAKRVILKPVKPITQKPKTQAHRKANDGTFRPSVVPLVVSPRDVAVGEAVTFRAVQSIHLGHAKLLGNPVEVRFTPLSQTLLFGDGASESSQATVLNATHGYATAGDYQAVLEVTFRVEYRVIGGSWYRDPQAISVAGAPELVRVHGSASTVTKPKVVLVTPNN